MHMGGMLAGIIIGMASFAQKKRDRSTGLKSRTLGQEVIVFIAALCLLVLVGGAGAALASKDIQQLFRSCPFCSHINCIPTPWWSCCITALRGSCPAIYPPANSSAPILAVCNMTGSAPFTASCMPGEDEACVWQRDDMASLTKLCALICAGCAA